MHYIVYVSMYKLLFSPYYNLYNTYWNLLCELSTFRRSHIKHCCDLRLRVFCGFVCEKTTWIFFFLHFWLRKQICIDTSYLQATVSVYEMVSLMEPSGPHFSWHVNCCWLNRRLTFGSKSVAFFIPSHTNRAGGVTVLDALHVQRTSEPSNTYRGQSWVSCTWYGAS